MRKFFIGSFLIILLIPFFWIEGKTEDYGPTARGIFISLPSSIFESTPEGLSDDDKDELLEEGKSEFWEIIYEDQENLIFKSLPFGERSIGLKLFRNEESGGAAVAIGSLLEPMCTLELWRVEPDGRILPMDAPDAPNIKEFFSRKRVFQNSKNSVLFCLEDGLLAARPFYWNRGEVQPLKTDLKIVYNWTGKEFKMMKMK